MTSSPFPSAPAKTDHPTAGSHEEGNLLARVGWVALGVSYQGSSQSSHGNMTGKSRKVARHFVHLCSTEFSRVDLFLHRSPAGKKGCKRHPRRPLSLALACVPAHGPGGQHPKTMRHLSCAQIPLAEIWDSFNMFQSIQGLVHDQTAPDWQCINS